MEVLLEMNEAEVDVMNTLAREMEMSPSAVMRQALRLYQLAHRRAGEGERMSFSGDAERARAFAGPSGLSGL